MVVTPEFCLEDLKKYENPPDSIASVLAGIRTEHFSNTNLKRYLFGVPRIGMRGNIPPLPIQFSWRDA